MEDEKMKVPEKVSTALAGWAEAKSDLERESALYHALRRERNYKILQAAARLAAANVLVHPPGEGEIVAIDTRVVDEEVARVHVNDAIALLEEIEKRNP